MKDAFLEIKDGGFYYENQEWVFENVSFQLAKGEIFTILGPNGAGKSSLLNCLGNLNTLKKGTITIDGKNILDYPRGELARKIGYVPQMQTKAYDFPVREYVAMGRAPYIGFWGTPSAEDYEMVDRILEKMNLTFLSRKPYTQLSGGECQQVMVARVLAQNPDIVIMDEPTNHLDYGNQLKILKLIKELGEEGFGVIFTTHMPDHALLVNGKTGILDAAGKMAVGNAGEMLTETILKELYGADLCLTYVEKVERNACLSYKI